MNVLGKFLVICEIVFSRDFICCFGKISCGESHPHNTCPTSHMWQMLQLQFACNLKLHHHHSHEERPGGLKNDFFVVENI